MAIPSNSQGLAPEFKITDPQSENELIEAGFGITQAKTQEVARWRVMTNLVIKAGDYLQNILIHTPRINQTIKRIDDLIQCELQSQNLSVDVKGLENYANRCLNMLHNIQMHENMARKFSENLILGENSPILASHIAAKERVLAQISRISAVKVFAEVFEPSDRKLDDSYACTAPSTVSNHQTHPSSAIEALKRRFIYREITHFSGIDQSILKQLCDQTDVRFDASPEFAIYLPLHLLLHESSPTYREILAKVRAQSHEMCATLPPNTPMGIIPNREFAFEACWLPEEHAVAITTGKNGCSPDHQAGRNQIGSFIAFEVTNALQFVSFNEVEEQAMNGAFELSDKMLGVDLYISKMEEIEQHGILIQSAIIAEARKTYPNLVDHQWDRWENQQAKRGIGCFMNSHGDYYRQHYITNYRPSVDKKFKSGTQKEKMAYQFQLARRKELE